MTAGLTHFYVVIQEGPATSRIERIRTSQSLQDTLTGLFQSQAQSFLDADLERVAFEGRYSVDESELFYLKDYQIDDQFKAAALHPNQFESVDGSVSESPNIKAVFSASHDRRGDAIILYFQAFNKARFISIKGFTLIHSGNTFKRLDEPGLTLDTKLAAVFEEGTLYFRSFNAINKFLDVQDYFVEATNEEIGELVEHPMILAGDLDALTAVANTWIRRRLTALRASGILDRITARRTANRAEKYGIEVQVKKKDGKDAIVFPTEKKDLKELLLFLNEGFFQGELTDTLYQTNSQRVRTRPSFPRVP